MVNFVILKILIKYVSSKAYSEIFNINPNKLKCAFYGGNLAYVSIFCGEVE
jgi:hypothetical protein